MTSDTPKRPRPAGRLAQCSKRNRLTRRLLGQWTAQPAQGKRTPSNLGSLIYSPL